MNSYYSIKKSNPYYSVGKINPYYSVGISRGKEFAYFSPNLQIEEILENEEHSRQSQDFIPISHWLNNSQEPEKSWLLYETGLVVGIDSVQSLKLLHPKETSNV